MNKTQLAALLTTLTGSALGGIVIVKGLLAPESPVIVDCAPDADCVMAVKPLINQCPVLLEGGGDRPGEVSGLNGENAAVARVLYLLLENSAINGFRTIPDDQGCKIGIQLSREQARAWRELLTGETSDNSVVEEALALLSPTSPTGLPVQWAGSSAPEDRTEAFDLTVTGEDPL